MQIKIVTPEDVRFNPETSMFEALVTLQTEDGICRYPCAFEGNINMPLSIAAHRLTQQAKTRDAVRDDMRACAVTAEQTRLGSNKVHPPRAA